MVNHSKHQDKNRIFEPAQSHSAMLSPTKCLSKLLAAMSDQGREKLHEYAFHPNWLASPDEILLSELEVHIIASYLKNQCSEMLPKDDPKKQLLLYGLAPIICNNALAYLMILLENYQLADEYLTESNRLVDICVTSPETQVIDQDYIVGLFHIVKGLKIVLDSHTGLLGKNFDVPGFLPQAFNDFAPLPLKANVAIAASKHFFMKLIRRDGALKYKNMDEIIFLDPDFFEWRVDQYLSLREERHRLRGNLSCPDEREIHAIQYAWNLAPYNPFCVVFMSLAVAETLRCQPVVGPSNPVVVGQFVFTSVDMVVAFVKDNCMKILKVDPYLIRINVLIAGILGDLMPLKHRDKIQARECIFQAFRYGQSVSSKANYHLAQFMLKGLKTPATSPHLSEPHLERACTLDRRNEDALYCLLQVYMSHPHERHNQIRSLFNESLTNADTTEDFVLKLVFLRGCFHMMMGEIEDGFVCFITAYVRSKPNRISFMMLRNFSYVFRIFRWPQEKLNLPHLILVAHNFLESYSASSDKDSYDVKGQGAIREIIRALCQALSADAFTYPPFSLPEIEAQLSNN